MTPDLSRAALTEIAAFLPIFEAPDFRFANNDSPLKQTGENSFEMVGYAYDKQVEHLIDALVRRGWIYNDESFQWTNWMQTEEAQHLRDNPAALATATPLQLARLMTIFVRQERFSDGAMLSFWEEGLLTGILCRARELALEGERL